MQNEVFLVSRRNENYIHWGTQKVISLLIKQNSISGTVLSFGGSEWVYTSYRYLGD